jgi:hypothetical protein
LLRLKAEEKLMKDCRSQYCKYVVVIAACRCVIREEEHAKENKAR